MECGGLDAPLCNFQYIDLVYAIYQIDPEFKTIQ